MTMVILNKNAWQQSIICQLVELCELRHKAKRNSNGLTDKAPLWRIDRKRMSFTAWRKQFNFISMWSAVQWRRSDVAQHVATDNTHVCIWYWFPDHDAYTELLLGRSRRTAAYHMDFINRLLSAIVLLAAWNLLLLHGTIQTTHAGE